MNELRIVLLVVGVAAIAGLYFWEAARERRQQRRRTVMAAPAVDAPSMRTRATPESEEDLSEALADLGRSMGQERGAATGAPAEDRIVALHVVSMHGDFEGSDILAAADDVALRWGPMRIFHRFEAGGIEYEKPLFSMASMREPGYIDREHPDEFRTPGVTLFMCMPAAAGDHIVFDLMLRTAEQVAKTLGGELRGPDHAPLDQFTLAGIRARLSA